MERNIIFVTALGRVPRYNREQYAAAARAYCKKFEGTDYLVLTDFPRYHIEADFCGLDVEVVPEERRHTHDHDRYYTSLFANRSVWEVCAVG